MNKFVVSMLLASTFSVAAYGANPVVAGSANIGKHPSYNTNYVGFWRTGVDYSVLTDGTNTFLNAPASDGTLYFRTANTDYAAMDRRGFSFFQDVAVNARLDVYGDFAAQAGLIVFPAAADLWTTVIGGSQYGLSANGTVLALDVQGPMFASAKVTMNDTLTVQNSITLNTSTARKSGGGSWLSLSDARVKEGVVDFDEGLSQIEQVRSVRFRYNGLGGSDASGQQFVGVIAQELEETAPYMVSSNKRKLHPNDKDLSDIKEVDPSAFTYLLINAVQELSEQNKAMKALLCKDHPKSELCKGKVSARHSGSRFASH